MAVKEKIYLEVLTPLPLTSRDEGDVVLRLWESHLPSSMPERVGNWEPVDQPCDFANRDAILRLWRWPFFVVRRSPPRMEAQVFMRKGVVPQHATWILDFDRDNKLTPELIQFLREAARLLEADFACLTMLTEAEIEAGRKSGIVSAIDRKATRFSFYIAPQDIEKCLPDVYWLTVFGAPYVRMFGRDKLLRAPAHRVEAIGENSICLQLTPSLEDLRSDPSAFAESKRRLKGFLDETAFYDPGRSSDDCKHPEFVWK